jgi:hypothetical protein
MDESPTLHRYRPDDRVGSRGWRWRHLNVHEDQVELAIGKNPTANRPFSASDRTWVECLR